MTKSTKTVGLAIAALLVIAATIYVFMTPYIRVPGVRIGGTLTPAPADWTVIEGEMVVQLKTGGFPPFVVNIFYTPDTTGIITATRPDGGYWAKRARINADGYMRVGDATYALQATEITGAARIPYLEKYGAKYNMPMAYDFEGEIITGANEPLHTWEVFYWTPR